MNNVLFPGRFQPFHAGHQAIVESILSGDRDVIILVRDTPLNEDNPYTMRQRIGMIRRAFPKEDRIKVREIDDFVEIAHGRHPGWQSLDVVVDHNLRRISATSLREGGIVWIFGQSKAGKTTLAKNLLAKLPSAINLDGDDMRETISVGAGFTPEDRLEHNVRVAKLATLLRDHGHTVIVSMIAPLPEIRQTVDQIAQPFWIHLNRTDHETNREWFFTPPGEYEVSFYVNRYLVVDNVTRTAEETAERAWPHVRAYLS